MKNSQMHRKVRAAKNIKVIIYKRIQSSQNYTIDEQNRK